MQEPSNLKADSIEKNKCLECWKIVSPALFSLGIQLTTTDVIKKVWGIQMVINFKVFNSSGLQTHKKDANMFQPYEPSSGQAFFMSL